MALLAVIIIIGIIVAVCSVQPRVTVSDIRNILTDIYTPRDMNQFIDSKAKYAKYMGDTNVLESLYTQSSSELTEADRTRTIDFTGIKVSEPDNNSLGVKLVDIKCIIQGDEVYQQLHFKFYVANGKIINYLAERWD